MKRNTQRSPEALAIILRRIYYGYFKFALATGYRIEWHELRSLSGLSSISLEYVVEVNKILNTRNLSLTAYVDFLVVDKLDRLQDLRILTPRVLFDNHPFQVRGKRYNPHVEFYKNVKDVDSNSYLRCGDGYYRSWNDSLRDDRWD